MGSFLTALQGAMFVLCLLCAARHDAYALKIPNRYIAGLILWRLTGVLAEHLLMFFNAPLPGAALLSGAAHSVAVSVFGAAKGSTVSALAETAFGATHSAAVLVFGAAAVAGIAAFAAALSRLFLKRRGIGAGDIKLFFACTLYLGFEKGLYLLLLSSFLFLLSHSIPSVGSVLSNNHLPSEKSVLSGNRLPFGNMERKGHPFGPFISLSAIFLYLL